MNTEDTTRPRHEISYSVGITGTKKGGSRRQVEGLRRLFTDMSINSDRNKKVIELHHGDCKGVDWEAFAIANKVFRNVSLTLITVSHPPLDGKHRAFTKNDQTRKAKEYLQRNMDIVDETDWMIALPDSPNEKLRSGTWATIRYAKKQNKSVIIILPSGVVRTIKIEMKK